MEERINLWKDIIFYLIDKKIIDIKVGDLLIKEFENLNYGDCDGLKVKLYNHKNMNHFGDKTYNLLDKIAYFLKWGI